MPTQTVAVINKLGMHARPAALFVQVASRFKAEVYVSRQSADPTRDDVPFEANGKSIMGVLMLQADLGDHLVIRAEGADAEEALRTLVTLVESRFGEE